MEMEIVGKKNMMTPRWKECYLWKACSIYPESICPERALAPSLKSL